MRSIKAVLGSLFIGTTLFVSGCGGGGSVDVLVDVSPPPFSVAFDVIMYANGVQVPGVEVWPGEEQTVYLPAGQRFVLDSSDPVDWTTVIGGSAIAGSGNTIYYGGATIVQTLNNAYELGASTYAAGLLPSPVPITVYATSLYYPGEVAKINIVLTN